MVKHKIQPWQVWWTDLDPQVGREQAGLRPAVVVGTALACSLPNGLAIVVPCTTTDRRLPVHLPITLGGKRGVAMCDQVKSISTDRLMSRHRGNLSTDEVDAIKFALKMLIHTAA